VLEGRSGSFHSRFVRDRTLLLRSDDGEIPALTEADLASLPPLMQVYVRRSGAVGRPRVRNVRVEFDAQMLLEESLKVFRFTTRQR